jgi:NAD-dependent SIR2 family protein deacetylase
MILKKVYCQNCNELVVPDITEYEEGLETFESGKLCPICEEYIY